MLSIYIERDNQYEYLLDITLYGSVTMSMVTLPYMEISKTKRVQLKIL